MRVVSTTSDSPVWTEISKIREELEQLTPIVGQYKNFPFDLVFCIRCLDLDSGWKSTARHYSKDEMLGMDIVVYRPDFENIQGDRDTQRKIVGKEFHDFFPKTMKKYEKKFPVLKEINPTFLPQVEQWLKDNQWID